MEVIKNRKFNWEEEREKERDIYIEKERERIIKYTQTVDHNLI